MHIWHLVGLFQLVYFRDPRPDLNEPIINPAMASYTGCTMAAEGTPSALCYHHVEHSFAQTISVRKITDLPHMVVSSLS